MAENTNIAWCDATFNLVWGCTKVSPGCKFCYADAYDHRLGGDHWGPGKERRTFRDGHWKKPLKWEEEASCAGNRLRVFSSSMCDNFEDHPVIDRDREKLWAIIRRTPSLDWLLLTKRAERIAGCLPPDWGTGYPNVWLGVSIENADYLWRADELRKVPARVRFISAEPLLGPLTGLNLADIHWLIAGGESGPHFRNMDLQWARDLRDQCLVKKVAFFFKQSSHRFPGRGDTLDGREWKDWPS